MDVTRLDEPQRYAISVKRTAMAELAKQHLALEHGIEATVREGEPESVLLAFCTRSQLKEAFEVALFECMDADLALVKEGLVAEPKFGSCAASIPGAVPVSDYL